MTNEQILNEFGFDDPDNISGGEANVEIISAYRAGEKNGTWKNDPSDLPEYGKKVIIACDVSVYAGGELVFMQSERVDPKKFKHKDLLDKDYGFFTRDRKYKVKYWMEIPDDILKNKR